MLKEAGVPSGPVLIGTKEYFNSYGNFPSLLFNHCIAAVYLKDKVIFLDPTAQTCAFGDLPEADQNRKVLLFKDEGYEIQDTPLYPAEHNLIKQRLHIKINNDESMVAEKSIFTSGIYDQGQRYWLLYTQPELIQEALKVKIQDVSIGARLNKYNIQNLENLNLPVVLSYTFEGPEYFSLAGSLRIMPQLAALDSGLVAQDKRKYDLDFSIMDTKEAIIEVEIPDNYVIKYTPDNVIQDSPWLRFIVEYSHKNNLLHFKQKAELKKNRVLQTEYIDFKHFFEGVAKKIKQRIVLEKVK